MSLRGAWEYISPAGALSAGHAMCYLSLLAPAASVARSHRRNDIRYELTPCLPPESGRHWRSSKTAALRPVGSRWTDLGGISVSRSKERPARPCFHAPTAAAICKGTRTTHHAPTHVMPVLS